MPLEPCLLVACPYSLPGHRNVAVGSPSSQTYTAGYGKSSRRAIQPQEVPESGVDGGQVQKKSPL